MNFDVEFLLNNIKYLDIERDTRKIISHHSYFISIFSDVTTAKNLELVQNLRDAKSEHTLFGIMNYCKTSGGSRMLRANILQPPSGGSLLIFFQTI